MGVPTKYYVDASLGVDTGDGSLATPWGRASGSVVQYALNTITRDSTNGDQINIKAGTADVLSSTLSFTTYGTPSNTAPCIFRGYTSTAGDGGIGEISGGGSVSIITGTGVVYTFFRDMKLGNCGSAQVLGLGAGGAGQAVDCEIHGTSGNGIAGGSFILVRNCHLHNIGGVGISGGGHIFGNYLKNGTNKFTSAITLASGSAWAIGNLISIDGSSNGIIGVNNNTLVLRNSILSSAGTGVGIQGSGGIATGNAFNNLVEGFSGVGGIGIQAPTADAYTWLHNAVYNCTTAYSVTGDQWASEDNETLSATPFAKSGSDTFANRFTYFAPVDTGNVHGGAYPSGSNLDKGAVQHADAGGSTTGRQGLHAIESGAV